MMQPIFIVLECFGDHLARGMALRILKRDFDSLFEPIVLKPEK
jgi:hypothetical protein